MARAVGIDLGTTNSLVATVRSGAAAVLPDSHGRPLLPSIVRYFKDGKVEVGYAAQARQAFCRAWLRARGCKIEQL